MPTVLLERPKSDEHVEYYSRYIVQVPGDDVVAVLKSQIEDTSHLLRGLSESQAMYRYAPDKWSIKQVVGHLSDGERVFAYRMMTIARGDSTSLPGFDENAYVERAESDFRLLTSLVHEFRAIRFATIPLVESLGPETGARRGTANNNPITPRALAWIIAGHEIHHYKLLKERYGLS
jgi:DinB superfamily